MSCKVVLEYRGAYKEVLRYACQRFYKMLQKVMFFQQTRKERRTGKMRQLLKMRLPIGKRSRGWIRNSTTLSNVFATSEVSSFMGINFSGPSCECNCREHDIPDCNIFQRVWKMDVADIASRYYLSLIHISEPTRPY